MPRLSYYLPLILTNNPPSLLPHPCSPFICMACFPPLPPPSCFAFLCSTYHSLIPVSFFNPLHQKISPKRIGTLVDPEGRAVNPCGGGFRVCSGLGTHVSNLISPHRNPIKQAFTEEIESWRTRFLAELFSDYPLINLPPAHALLSNPYQCMFLKGKL